MIKDLTQIICKYRKIVVSLHRKVKIANTLYRGYIVPSWRTPNDGQTLPHVLRGVPNFGNMDTKKYVAEISANENVVDSLATLNAYKSELLNTSKDTDLLEAAKALETAKRAYKKAANSVVLGDRLYLNLQTECVRTAVSEFSRTHRLAAFFAWFDENGKDEQTAIVDTPQKLGSKLKALHDSFASGSKVARKKKASIDELRAQLAAKQKELEAMQAQMKELGGE